jgi:hypothetical protein
MKDKEGSDYSTKEIIAFFVIIAVSILVGIASDNYWGGIITFLVLGLIAIMVHIQMRAHKTKPIAQKLLKQERPNKAELDKCIDDLGGSAIGDEESKELIRRLMAKRDELENS